MSCNYKTSFYFAGQAVTPTNWEEISVLATFEDTTEAGTIQEATISVDELRFTGEDARLIHARALNGLTGGVGITEGEDFKILFSSETNVVTVFEGIVNFMNGYRFGKFIKGDRTQPSEVFVRIEKLKSVSRIDDIISGTTYGLLNDKGVFSESDWVSIPWVEEKEYDALEALYIGLAVVMLIKEATELPEKIASDVATVSGIAASGLTGPVGSVLYAVLIIVIRAAYIAIMVIAWFNLVKEIANILFPKVRYHKGATLRTLLSKAFGYYDLKFVSPIPELDTYVFLPTLPAKDSNFIEEALKKIRVTDKGIPSVQDQGFILSQMVQICKQMFNARLVMVDGLDGEEVHLRTNSDTFWLKQSNVQVLEDVKVDEYTFNTDELYLDRFFTFTIDYADDFTRKHYEGTSYEVITEQVTTKDQKKVNISGLKESRNPWALGNRKDKFTLFEKELLFLAQTAEDTINTLGGNIDLTSKLKNKVNALKVSQPEHSVAKILYMPDGTGIPANHRDKLSAKYLVETYGQSDSFVVIDPDTAKPTYNNQHINFNGITVPFNIDKFINIVENSYFVTDEGESGKAKRLEWFMAQDKAELDGWLRFRYTENLQERKIE